MKDHQKFEHQTEIFLNEEFCSYLEYHLCKTFKNSANKSIQKLWCDGISHEPIKKEARKLTTTAWIGYDGQDEYEMVINFGDKFFEKYKIGLNLKECFLSETSMEWIKLDKDKKSIELWLN